jgi:hypothetical protein
MRAFCLEPQRCAGYGPKQREDEDRPTQAIVALASQNGPSLRAQRFPEAISFNTRLSSDYRFAIGENGAKYHAGKKIKGCKRHIGGTTTASCESSNRSASYPLSRRPTSAHRGRLRYPAHWHEYAAAFANGGGSAIAIAQERIGVSLLLEVA